MKLYTPEISWHACEAIYSVDFDPTFYRYNLKKFATSGVDQYIRIWCLGTSNTNDLKIDFICDLSRHQKAVNIVRYSPNGLYLASGDDDGIIFIWERVNKTPLKNNKSNFADALKENWRVIRTLRGHVQDICDLAWSPDNKFIFSCAQDKTCILWEITKTKYIHIFNDHKNFVQGVAWDPLNKYIASLGRDRICRIYNIKTKKTKFKIMKSTLTKEPKASTENTLDSSNKNKTQTTHLFQDENLKSFFRRLTFTPLGELMILPTGCIESGNDYKPVSYIFSRSNLKSPIAYLPCFGKSSSVVKCCPILFKLRNLKTMPEVPFKNAFINLPYRIVFAVLEESTLVIYDTQQLYPLMTIQDIHYWWLSDLSWSPDGLVLVASSTDGYCTIISFTPFELGVPYHPPLSLELKRLPKENLKGENIEKTANTNFVNHQDTPHLQTNLILNLDKHSCLLENILNEPAPSTFIASEQDLINVDTQGNPSDPKTSQNVGDGVNTEDPGCDRVLTTPLMCTSKCGIGPSEVKGSNEEMLIDQSPTPSSPKPTPFNIRSSNSSKHVVIESANPSPRRRITPITLVNFK